MAPSPASFDLVQVHRRAPQHVGGAGTCRQPSRWIEGGCRPRSSSCRCTRPRCRNSKSSSKSLISGLAEAVSVVGAVDDDLAFLLRAGDGLGIAICGIAWRNLRRGMKGNEARWSLPGGSGGSGLGVFLAQGGGIGKCGCDCTKSWRPRRGNYRALAPPPPQPAEPDPLHAAGPSRHRAQPLLSVARGCVGGRAVAVPALHVAHRDAGQRRDPLVPDR